MSDEQGEAVESPDDGPDEGHDAGTDDAAAEANDVRDGADEQPSGDDADRTAAAGASDEQGEGDGNAPEETADDAAAGTEVDLDEVEELVETHDAPAVAREIAGLRERVAELESALEDARADRDDLESRLKRKQAEFQNYKKRQSRRREQERARATEHLVERLLEVRDNLQRALEQDDDADIREGVEATFRQLDEVLRSEGVDPIEPDPGTGVDPQRHEVLLKVDGEEPPGTVESVHRPGYEMAEKVLRPAQVTVSEGDAATDEGSRAGGTGGETPGDDETGDGEPPAGGDHER